jgi:biopolymer transport protein TolR
MGMSSAAEEDFVSEINVTPFVDVMLVLLIIFMVTVPMMVEGLGVDLPRVQSSELLPVEDDHMILTIRDDGGLFLDEYPVPSGSLPATLEAQVVNMKKQLFLRADRNVPYGVVMDVMGTIRAAGISNLGMVTAPEGPGGREAGNGTQNPGNAGPQ